MKQRFIEWELEQDPNILARFYTGKMVDAGALRHVICNVDPPEGVSFEDTMKVLNEVAETVQLIQRLELRNLSITRTLWINYDAAVATAEYAKDVHRVEGRTEDPRYCQGWEDACQHIREHLENLIPEGVRHD